jgi:hypothetical protein
MLGGKSISWLRGCSVECGVFERLDTKSFELRQGGKRMNPRERTSVRDRGE